MVKLSENLVNQSGKMESSKEFCDDRNYEFKIMTEDDLGIQMTSSQFLRNFYGFKGKRT